MHAACLVAQSCLTLFDPMDCNSPASSVHGILQARLPSGLPFPSPGDLPNPGIESRSPTLQADSSPSELTISRDFPGGPKVKNLPADMQETWVQSLRWEDPLEQNMAIHLNILPWEIPRTEEPAGL